VYSPEWQALQVAAEVGAEARFIDLPWVGDGGDDHGNRYADGPLRYGQYVERLCSELGVDDFDAAWDELVEIEELAPDVYLRRAHELCVASRLLDPVSERDRRREAFMAEEVRAVLARVDGRVLVVTGGYHSAAILEALDAAAADALPAPADAAGEWAPGVALTPYSYERLDRLTGYAAGMPAPGFYHRVWEDRRAGGRFDADAMLAAVAEVLRARKQILSTADLIAAATAARGLATLRGHAQVWRRDLIDGLRSAVLKDELAHGGSHPLVDAIDAVLRGDRRGRIAEGAPRPPLVVELMALLERAGLIPDPGVRRLELDLESPADAGRSRLLHRVRLLGIAGFVREDGTDFAGRADLTRLWERWKLAWSPELDATAIEATRYGGTVDEAVEAVITERVAAAGRHAGAAAELLVEAALAAVAPSRATLAALVEQSLAADTDLASVAAALGHVLYLHRFERALAAAGIADLAPLLAAAWHRARWLLEAQGTFGGSGAGAVNGIALLVATFEEADELPRGELTDTLARVAAVPRQAPAVAGAALGALWALGAADGAQALGAVGRFRDPARLGDYLTGLFTLAREAVQRSAELTGAIDEVVAGYTDDEFLEAAPALTLAFARFTPREKLQIARALRGRRGDPAAAVSAPLAVDAAEAARALELEGQVFAVLARYRLRGGDA
jgi:hypothetical protein